MDLDKAQIKETTELSNMVIDEAVDNIDKSEKVSVQFARLTANVHANSEVIDAILHLIRFGTNRQHFSPYQLGQSLPNEETEKANIFHTKFNQPILFIPDNTYILPRKEAMQYKKKFGTYKETYREGPMFFKSEEEYQRALDTKEFVIILED